MKSKFVYLGQRVLFVFVSLCLFATASCKAPGLPESVVPVEPGNVALLNKLNNFTISLYVLMDFDYSGSTVTYPTELSAVSIPIEWMERIFSGDLKEAGTYQVHGSLSEDGQYLESVLFSYEITRQRTNEKTFYRVTLRNVPIAKPASTTLGKFEKTGAEVQRYIVKIEYTEGPLSGTNITPVTTFLSADWKNVKQGQTPILKLDFSASSGPRPTPKGM